MANKFSDPQQPIRKVVTGTRIMPGKIPLGYARTSTANEEQQSSLRNQEARLREAGCVKVWIETYTGTDFENRVELNKLIDHAKELAKHQPVEIIVCDFNRLGRGIDRPWLIKRLEKLSISVRSLSEGTRDLNSPHDELIENVMASVDGFYAAEVRYKVRRSKVEARRQCRPLGNRAPFGYQWSADKTKYEPNPETWGIAKELVQQFLSGKGQLPLAKWLKEEHDIERSPTAIYEWLRSPTIRGHLRYRWTEDGQKRERIEPNTHQALITPAEDKAIALRFKLNKAHPPRKKDQPVYAISGLLFCQTCKRRMHRCNVRGYVNFRCRGRHWRREKCPESGVVAASRVEPEILKAVCGYAEEIAKAVLQPDKPIENPRIIELEAELSGLQSLWNQSHRDTVRTAIEEIEREISLLRGQDQDSRAFRAEQAETIKALADPDFWEGLSEKERNHIYRDLKVKVWCRGREIVRVDIGR